MLVQEILEKAYDYRLHAIANEGNSYEADYANGQKEGLIEALIMILGEHDARSLWNAHVASEDKKRGRK